MRPDPAKPEPDHAIPKEIAGAVNLMAHPAAGMMALSALSLGVASQMMGMWLGAVTGAAQAAQRIAAAVEPGRSAADVEKVEITPAPRVPATVTVLADRRAPSVKPGRKAVTPAGPPSRPEGLKKVVSAAASAKPAAAARPASPDDLKQIDGVGPKLESVLNGLGIWTYGQISAWTPAEIAWVDEHLAFGGRIGRDDWVAQAGRLAGVGT